MSVRDGMLNFERNVVRKKPNRIKLPDPPNRDKEEIHVLRTAIKDARYIHRQYKDSLPEEAWETIGKILNDPKLKTRGGTH